MLIKTTEQFRTYVPINALTQYGTLEPYINKAEVRFLRYLLGNDLYNTLDAITDNGTGDTATLLNLVRLSLANMTMYLGFDMLNIQFDETGFKRSSADKTLYRYQEENLKSMFRNNGFDAIDNILELLQEKVDVFPSFKNSGWYIATNGAFFKTTAQFNAIYNINHSRLVFIKIAAYFDRVVDFEIIPAMGRALYDKVKGEMVKTESQDASLMALVPYIQRAMAFLSISMACNELNYNITDKGIVYEKQTAIGNNHIETSLADAQQTELIKQSSKSTGNSYLNMLVTYLTANKATYPDYLQTVTTINPFRRDNAGKKSVWL